MIHHPSNIILMNLALSDLGVGVCVMPFTAASFIQLREYNVSYTARTVSHNKSRAIFHQISFISFCVLDTAQIIDVFSE